VVIGLLATFVPDEPGRSFPIYLPSLPGTVEAMKTGIVTLASSFIASLVGMVVLSRVLPKMVFFRAIVPANPTPADIAPDDAYRGAAHLGNRGTTKSPLHPAGKALFGSVLVDVVSRGEFIETDTEIEVIKRRGHRVVVRAVE